MTVKNNIDVSALLDFAEFLEIFDKIRSQDLSSGRQNRRFEFGTCGMNNTFKCPDTGLAKPQSTKWTKFG
jgi:hypothetical protein